MLTNEDVNLIASQSILAHTLSDKDLLEFCIIANQSYRSGNPIISDDNYDFIFIETGDPHRHGAADVLQDR